MNPIKRIAGAIAASLIVTACSTTPGEGIENAATATSASNVDDPYAITCKKVPRTFPAKQKHAYLLVKLSSCPQQESTVGAQNRKSFLGIQKIVCSLTA